MLVTSSKIHNTSLALWLQYSRHFEQCWFACSIDLALLLLLKKKAKNMKMARGMWMWYVQ